MIVSEIICLKNGEKREMDQWVRQISDRSAKSFRHWCRSFNSSEHACKNSGVHDPKYGIGQNVHIEAYVTVIFFVSNNANHRNKPNERRPSDIQTPAVWQWEAGRLTVRSEPSDSEKRAVWPRNAGRLTMKREPSHLICCRIATFWQPP